MYFATLGVVAALRAREVTGEGQAVETSLLQGALAAVCLNWQRVERPDAPSYWMWPSDSRSIDGLYECADGRWVHHWSLRPSWVLGSVEGEDLKPMALETAYRDDPDRLSMDGEGLLTGIFLHPQLAEAFKKHSSASWVRAGSEAQLGVGMVRSPAEALADDAFRADGCVVEIEDPEVGRIRHVGNVLEFSATPGPVTRPAPRSGEHTAAVLAEAAAASPGSSQRWPSGRSLGHALEGVRVLDLGLGVAGPFAGRVLADLGADVIKVDALHDGFWAGTHMGLGSNRGKRSIAVNLKDERGGGVLDTLLERADVLLTNWRPGAAARLGLDYETLRGRFPALVYCNTRGYEKGPRSDLPGTDQTASALTGVEWEDGACDAGNPPLWPRSNMGDTGNAMLAAIAISAALFHREKTGEGQAVSTSIVNAGLLHTSYAWIDQDGAPAEWRHVDGQQYGLSPFYRLYRCADDGWVFLAALRPEDRTELASAIGAPESGLEDPESCVDLLESRLRERPAKEWFAGLDEAGVPVELVDETFCRRLFDDPKLRAGGLVAETWAANVGRFEDPGLLVNLSSTSGVVQRGPCMCGEHSREVLSDHGYSEDEVDALIADGVILDAAVETT
jgi:crotonobetainyl-CoA:carnitine CoA-transferase CaiB-like acyl-CoA transferase